MPWCCNDSHLQREPFSACMLCFPENTEQLEKKENLEAQEPIFSTQLKFVIKSLSWS